MAYDGTRIKNNVIIQFKVSSKMIEIIDNKKNALGYSTRSAMIRDLLLKDDLAVHSKLNQIIELVKGQKNGKK